MFVFIIVLITIYVAPIVFAAFAVKKLSAPYRLPVFVGFAVLFLTPSWVPVVFVVVPIPFAFLLYGCIVGGYQDVVKVIAGIWFWYVLAFPTTGIIAYLVGRKIFYIKKCPACKKYRRKNLGKHCKFCGTEFDFN